MAITTRAGKGSPLTNDELDSNFTTLAQAIDDAELPSGSSTDYIRGNKTLSNFAGDVANTVLEDFQGGTVLNPINQDDTILSAFNKVQANLYDLQDSLGGKQSSLGDGEVTEYLRGDKTWQTLDKATVGLSDVDNTSDVNKPVSTAQQTALDAKFDKTGGLIDGDIEFTGVARRIRGDFSNATNVSRLMFQTSTANGNTVVQLIPSGTATASYLGLMNNSDATNGNRLVFGMSNTAATMESQKQGTGTYLPLQLYTGGVNRLQIDTDGTTRIYSQLAISNGLSVGPASGNGALVDDLAKNSIQLLSDDSYGDAYDNHRVARIRGAMPGGWGSGYIQFVLADTNGNYNNIPLLLGVGGSTSYGSMLVSGIGLGYTAGSGGTVTQATSKSTAVTLNKACGRITTFNTTMAASSAVVFTVNNSLIAANDVVMVTTTSSNYYAVSIGVTTGSFGIRLLNISAGSLSEAVGINFAIIKGSTT